MQCPYIPEVSFDELGRRLRDRSAADRIPLLGSIELTFRCNLNCVHCYCNVPLSDKEAQAQELTFEEICGVIDEIAGMGCLCLLITGGEPLVRRDFLDIYVYAKKRGLLVTLFTNGTMLNPQILDCLQEWPPRRVEITLYGATSETHDRVTRVPGSHERCVRAIGLLLERGIPLGLKTTLTNLNKQELWDVKDYARRLGVDFRFDAVLHARLDGGKTPHEYRISPREVVELDVQDGERWKEWQKYCQTFWPVEVAEAKRLYSCGAGQNTFHIDPYGQLGLCLTDRAHMYDLREGAFHDGWDEFIPKVRSLPVTQETDCRMCADAALCGHCPAWSHLEHGDLETPVTYLCEIGRLRAGVFGPLLEDREGNNGSETLSISRKEAVR